MEFNMSVDARDFLSQIKLADRRAKQAAEVAMNNVVDELIRIASEITPFDKGTLTRSHTKKIEVLAGDVKSQVEFSIREGDFNYALWIHEGIYNHGEGTMRRSGTTGWSGKRYYVGRKYLERPLKGEEQAFYQHIADKIKEAVGG
jgi:hypothetical protein